jgi:hypothetical protein
MSIKGLTLSATFTYESDADPDKGTPQATTFTLRPLDVFVHTHLFDSAIDMKGDSVSFRTNGANLEAVRFGLVGFVNFKDEMTGGDIAFATEERNIAGRKYQAATDDVLARIPFADVRAMATQIRNYSVVTEADAKN